METENGYDIINNTDNITDINDLISIIKKHDNKKSNIPINISTNIDNNTNGEYEIKNGKEEEDDINQKAIQDILNQELLNQEFEKSEDEDISECFKNYYDPELVEHTNKLHISNPIQRKYKKDEKFEKPSTINSDLSDMIETSKEEIMAEVNTISENLMDHINEFNSSRKKILKAINETNKEIKEIKIMLDQILRILGPSIGTLLTSNK